MQTLSTLSIDRAVNRLAKHTKQKYTIQVTDGPYAQIIDDSGDILDYDHNPPDLVRRLNNRVDDIELAEFFKE